MKLRLPNKIHTENVDESEFVRWFNATIVDFSQSFSSGKGSHLLVFIIAGDLQKKKLWSKYPNISLEFPPKYGLYGNGNHP